MAEYAIYKGDKLIFEGGVDEIAKHFGGGGHKKASGFPLNSVKLNAFINDIFDIKEGD